jgi:predicted kinase
MDLMNGPVLIILTGLVGTGKSTVGKMIAKRIGAVMLSTDVIRRELFPKRTYSKEESRRTYEEMLERAAKLLSKNKSVILDATFSKEDYRNEAKDIARKTKSGWQVVELTCDPKVIRERFSARKKTSDPSEATYLIYLRMRKWYERPSGRHITIDNSGGPKETEKQVQKHF